ncbi:alkaline phosphatase family protein [Pelagicoccus albus]|uniref:Alkaline phosphatase family protein n=1 Tax=Pelagicoccus albus TaxID=415222 RepID=A0A7X1E8D4_9BACT|nr:nucleotide pyrophosphatase/phosphodiesterase family protein [Pelagicoccus albus]MBC2606156.1 alkaline phosphatase family protein [Pelagicoccus albus]
MRRTAVINIVALSARLIGPHTPNILAYARKQNQASYSPSFPALTCTSQSDILTGKKPSEHGIVANGWYNRDYSEVHFWKQSNHLVKAPKIWETLKKRDPEFTCAKLFWWYNMYSTADYTITPRPMYPADGRKVFDIYTQPMGMREEIKKDLGEFPFFTFWGPKAGIECSQWIAKSAMWTEEKQSPTLSLVYLPHLDYNLQRLGPKHPDIAKDLQAIDSVVGELIDFYEARGVQVILLSEYGITDVDTPIHINRALREKGWLNTKEELGLEQLDAGISQAFAVADHQIAHVYLNDSSIAHEVRETLLSLQGVDQVLDRNQQKDLGIDHERSGDFIAVANENAWFTYYYWLDDNKAPDFARTIDIHRKPGYDPVELFIDPKLKLPPARIAKFLLKKKLGFRALLDVIPLDASLVKGSHGCRPSNKQDWPVLISPLQAPENLESIDIHDLLLSHFEQ